MTGVFLIYHGIPLHIRVDKMSRYRITGVMFLKDQGRKVSVPADSYKMQSVARKRVKCKLILMILSLFSLLT